MKKLSAILLIFIISLSSVAFAEDMVTEEAIATPAVQTSAESEIKVIVNNEEIEFDVPPQLIDGRTMVPMRKIFEALGADVQWFEESQLIFAGYSSCIMAMEIGKKSFIVTDIIANTEKTIELDVAPVIIDGRTMVPVRAISESMGLTVEWIEETQTVIIY